jgi:hypothetical protein
MLQPQRSGAKFARPAGGGHSGGRRIGASSGLRPIMTAGSHHRVLTRVLICEELEMNVLSASRGVFLAGLILALTPGCPPADQDAGGTGNNNNGQVSLTTREDATIAGLAQAVAALVTGTGAVQGATTENEGQSAQETPGEVTFGQCPVVTLSGDPNLVALTVEADFGGGCEAVAGSGYVLSGVAAGRYDVRTSDVTLTFDDLAGSEGELSGEVRVSFNRVGSRLDIDGDFDIGLRGADLRVLSADGVGQASFDTDDAATTIERFSGTLSDSGGVWNAAMSDVSVSFAQFDNLIPFAGTASVAGTDVRDITVRFDANSPVTGEVQVSVEGGDFFTVNLLEE